MFGVCLSAVDAVPCHRSAFVQCPPLVATHTRSIVRIACALSNVETQKFSRIVAIDREPRSTVARHYAVVQSRCLFARPNTEPHLCSAVHANFYRRPTSILRRTQTTTLEQRCKLCLYSVPASTPLSISCTGKITDSYPSANHKISHPSPMPFQITPTLAAANIPNLLLVIYLPLAVVVATIHDFQPSTLAGSSPSLPPVPPPSPFMLGIQPPQSLQTMSLRRIPFMDQTQDAREMTMSDMVREL